MKLKIFMTAFCLLLSLFFNPANASVWYPITGASGNTQEIELDTINVDDNYVVYFCRRTDKNYTYVTQMKIDLNNKTVALLNMKALLNGQQVSYKDNSNNMEYTPVKKGSLAEAVYNMMMYVKQNPALDVKMGIWEKYFKRQQRIVQRRWHPNFNSYPHTPEDRAVAYVTLVIGKDGTIIERTYQNNTNTQAIYKEFNEGLKQKINNIFVKTPKFEPLPREFKGERIIVVLKFEYSFKHDAKSQNITWEETGIGYLENGKNQSGWVGLAKFIYAIAGFPFEILSVIFLNKDIYGWL